MSYAKWGEVKAKADAIRRENGTLRTPQEVEQQKAQVRAYRLKEIRKALGLTQVEVAQAMGTVQANISRIEHGELSTSEVDTLRRYIEALGGRLRIVADFGDRQFDAA
ncbi:hypothetical protein BIV57_04195 [Mangrovactinospora gilvigrisea]|uniref:HTH cro/C1-type domain-containing protein n=1 Tax=Mangrovactinospora gilvigrisea TaxID=1428644 RepID=A0A1J7BJ95_9ACTN|nr:XRE family transcriptional regulator [Mangrovactinospora gilvigrisea]OIV38751.1 hypothetical protein BIV57_04195 [Mangrovactinospora gilvigrisea]